MPKGLTDLQTLRTALGRLNSQQPASVDDRNAQRMLYADRDDDFQRRLDLALRSRQNKARILVTGQIGVGKSSELACYARRNKTRNRQEFYISCDLEREMHPEHCGATAVFLAMFRDCWSAISKYFEYQRQDLDRFRDETIDSVVGMLHGEYTPERTEVKLNFRGMEFRVDLHPQNRDSALHLMLGKAALHEAVSKPVEKFGIAPDTLINQLNRVLGWLSNRQERWKPVVFIDHVDKIRDPDSASEVLLDAIPQWSRLEASLVLTAPFEYTLGEYRNSIESRWGRPLVVYPVATPDEHDGPIPTLYLNIAMAAGLGNLIEQNALRTLAFYSGGVLRDFVRFLNEACLEANLAGNDRIGMSEAMLIAHRAARSYQDYSRKQLELLDEIEESGSGLGEAAVLLRSPIGLLVRNAGGVEDEIVVHPLARTALARHRNRRRKAESLHE